ncbi:AAA ATPase [Elasticomyces elasticus]|nr:AAA ATPase [Elasticomyces elasticus]
MSASVLGKRTRQASKAAESESYGVVTRSRRCVDTPHAKDRTEISLIDDCVDVDEKLDELPFLPKAKKLCIPPTTAPAQRSLSRRRVVLSPSKISTHFQASKPAIDIYEDGKPTPVATPQTPRHRDALSKKVPATPRHRVLAVGSKFTPRTPRTPRTPSSPFNYATGVYNDARQAFTHRSQGSRLVGRDDEKNEVSSFISPRLESKAGGCLYISGPPGTGKSALLSQVCKDNKWSEQAKLSTINCMSVKSARDIHLRLCEDLNLQDEVKDSHLEMGLRNIFLKSDQEESYVVILDEVDRLVDLDITLLYSLFETSMQPSSNLILIGIANALDLTDRFLPRLRSRGLKPNLLPFMPYTAAQIASVITSKLQDLVPSDQPSESKQLPFFHPAAIQLCSKKVASHTGDLRKAFDICSRALDVVEREAREQHRLLDLQNSPSKTVLMENTNLSSPPAPKSPDKPLRQTKLTVTMNDITAETAPRVTIAHIAKVTAAVFGNGANQRLQFLNLQQKAVLCALAAFERKKRESASSNIFATPSKHANTAPSIKQLFEAYGGLCGQEKLLHPLTSTEFRDVVSGLETLSLISATEGKYGSLAVPLTPSKTPSRKGKGGFAMIIGDERRVASCVGQKELLSALDGPGSEILKDMIWGDVSL